MKVRFLSQVAVLFVLSGSSAFAGEFNYGQGTMSVKGGFMGLSDQASDNVTVYSLKSQHHNLFGTKAFYSYRLSWYDSNEMVAGQQQFNQASNTLNGWLPSGSSPFTLPSMDYRLQGLDANLSLGYDLLHQGERDFLGLGVLLGVSTPWIDSKKSSSDSSGSNLNIPDTKTEFWTYKIGPSLVARKSLGDYFSLYGSFAYAYQTAHIKNTKLNVSTDVDGQFVSYDLGVRFQPISADYQLGWFTLSPRLYATAGIRNSHWQMDKVGIDVSGQNLPVPKTQLEFNASETYLGFGFNF